MTARHAHEILADRAKDGLAALAHEAKAKAIQVELQRATIASLEKEVALLGRLVVAMLAVNGPTTIRPADATTAEAMRLFRRETADGLFLTIGPRS